MLKMLEQYKEEEVVERMEKSFVLFQFILFFFFSFQKISQNYKRQKTHIKK
jgi:hypothetical protein